MIQTIGRAARNSEGRVIMYADKMTKSMDKAIDETNRRRAIQMAYNEKHGITPTTVVKSKDDILKQTKVADSSRVAKDYTQEPVEELLAADPVIAYMSKDELKAQAERVKSEMEAAAAELDFIKAAKLRDEYLALARKAGINV